MIGMKGFLISETDQNEIIQTIKEAKMDALTRVGAMLHVFAREKSAVTAIELNSALNENTELPMYTEFIHSENAISGFMLILQNAFGGLFLAFTLVLSGITMAVSGHSISAVMEQEYRNMGIFKSLGFSSVQLRITFALRFAMTAVIGAVIGTVLAAVFTDPLVSSVMKLAGISNFVSAPNPGMLLMPGVTVVVLFALFACLASGKIKRVDMAVLTAE